jgi:hypothetical protein
MPIKTNLDVSPYFDDYDANNQYHRVLFRPSVAVQARELTQLQSILQNQIEQFANWAFKSGDIIPNSGCSTTDQPKVDFVRLADSQTNGHSYNMTDLANLMVYSATTNLHASVLYSSFGLTGNYPNTKVIYVNYENSGEASEKIFAPNETLTFYNGPYSNVVAVVNSFANAVGQNTTGFGHGITLGAGIVYLNGTFVQILNPTWGIVTPFDTYAGNTVVGIIANESIVTENVDTSLLDNALGYSNENAPGAHRLKIEPVIISLSPENAAKANNFVPFAQFNYGQLYNKQASTDINSKLQDALAKRTYNESGNYVVKPFTVDTITVTGEANVDNDLSANDVHIRIHPGSGYAQGYEVTREKTTYSTIRRGVDLKTNEKQQITFNYGGYFILNEVAGSFNFDRAQQIDLYDTPLQAVTTRVFNSLSASTYIQNGTIHSNKIGTALARCFTYNNGNAGSASAQYILHVFNIKMNNGYNTNQIKAVFNNSGVKGVGDVVGTGLQNSATKDQLYSFGSKGLKNFQDSLGNINTEYMYRKKTTASMDLNGDVAITITNSHNGGLDELPYGGDYPVRLPDIDAINFILVANQTITSDALGTATISTTSTNVTGSGFLSNFTIGDEIEVSGEHRVVVSVVSDTKIIVDAVWSSSTTSGYFKRYSSGKIIPITQIANGPQSYVTINSSTSFTIHCAVPPASTIPVDVYYDILRVNTVPAKKEIRKNRFVKINMDTNKSGPWCLGFSDIHQIRNIYGAIDGTYYPTNADVKNMFTYDTGQKDTHYDLGYLYPKTGFDSSMANNLLIELDYFIANTTQGVGFFTVESYPIDDENAANTTAITTANIPLYIDEAGKKIPLRDYIDFRTPSIPTAGDFTDPYDPGITLNPSSTLNLNIPVTGTNIPSYGKNLQSDYTFYLPRKDLVIIAPDPNSTGGIIKIKEGLSSVNPQTPLYPENAMTIAVLDIPAYPSLSSDQLDSLLPINQFSKNLIRDTSLSITSSNVSNRRYTMKDVGTLDSRITNLEYYAALSIVEKKATDMTITDANGLNRFKNGIFVDSFTDFTKSEVSNPDYSLAINSVQGRGRPRILREVIDIELNNRLTSHQSSGIYPRHSLDYFVDDTNKIQRTGRLVTLPYTEVSFIAQPFATKYRSSAHVSLAWNGKIVLVPEYDNHNDYHNTGSVNITVDISTPWKDFAKSPFGSIWGDWETSTKVDVGPTVTTAGGNIDQVDLGDVGFYTNQQDAEAAALAIIHQKYGQNVVIGKLNIHR